MDIGDWTWAPQTGPLYRQLRALDLEQNVAELDAFGYTVLEPGRIAPLEWVEQVRERLLHVAEQRTGVRHDIETGTHGTLEQEPRAKGQYLLYYLLLEDRVFQEALLNPYVLALQTYLLGLDCRLSSMFSIVKWQEEDGYGPTLALHADSVVPAQLTGGRETHAGNATLVLTDYTKENGALAVVPGSHREGRQPNIRLLEGKEHAVPIEAPAGSLIVWNGNLWHGAFPRTNPGLRLSLTMYFNRAYLQMQEDYRPHLTEELLASHPKRFAVLAGLGQAYGWTSPDGPSYSRAAEAIAGAAREAEMESPGIRYVT